MDRGDDQPRLRARGPDAGDDAGDVRGTRLGKDVHVLARHDRGLEKECRAGRPQLLKLLQNVGQLVPAEDVVDLRLRLLQLLEEGTLDLDGVLEMERIEARPSLEERMRRAGCVMVHVARGAVDEGDTAGGGVEKCRLRRLLEVEAGAGVDDPHAVEVRQGRGEPRVAEVHRVIVGGAHEAQAHEAQLVGPPRRAEDVRIEVLELLVEGPRVGEHHLAISPDAMGAAEELDEGEEVGVLEGRDAARQQAVAHRRQDERQRGGVRSHAI